MTTWFRTILFDGNYTGLVIPLDFKDRYVLFICSFSTIEIVIVDYIGDVEIRECHQQGVDGG